jgi:diamine N-acetyltransferase
VALVPARPEHRRLVYEWLACSDVTRSFMGPPDFVDNPIPTWEEFDGDEDAFLFEGEVTERGRCFLIVRDEEPIGAVIANDVFERDDVRRVELDIWMRSEADCGRGLGGEALDVLCRHLSDRFGVDEFMVQPSARNARAIRAYEKVGFRRLDVSIDEARAAWGPSDYHDSVYMVKSLARGGPP